MSAPMSARAKARAARARIDAQRAAKVERVDAAAMRYHQQVDHIERAQAQLDKAQAVFEERVEQARREQDAAVVEMLDEGEPAAVVAQLLDLTPAAVGAAKKRHHETRGVHDQTPTSSSSESSSTSAADGEHTDQEKVGAA